MGCGGGSEVNEGLDRWGGGEKEWNGTGFTKFAGTRVNNTKTTGDVQDGGKAGIRPVGKEKKLTEGKFMIISLGRKGNN